MGYPSFAQAMLKMWWGKVSQTLTRSGKPCKWSKCDKAADSAINAACQSACWALLPVAPWTPGIQRHCSHACAKPMRALSHTLAAVGQRPMGLSPPSDLGRRTRRPLPKFSVSMAARFQDHGGSCDCTPGEPVNCSRREIAISTAWGINSSKAGWTY